MKLNDVIKYFWEELNAYTLNNHRFNDGFKELVNASIERAIIRAQNDGRMISMILWDREKKKKTKQKKFINSFVKDYDKNRKEFQESVKNLRHIPEMKLKTFIK